MKEIPNPKLEILVLGTWNLELNSPIGADALIYQTVEGLVKAVGSGSTGFCTACFTGSYPTEISPSLLERIEADRMTKQISGFKE